MLITSQAIREQFPTVEAQEDSLEINWPEDFRSRHLYYWLRENCYRIMHARTAFDPNSGYRHLQGCYVCRDDLQSRLEVLRRKGGDFRHT